MLSSWFVFSHNFPPKGRDSYSALQHGRSSSSQARNAWPQRCQKAKKSPKPQLNPHNDPQPALSLTPFNPFKSDGLYSNKPPTCTNGEKIYGPNQPHPSNPSGLHPLCCLLGLLKRTGLGMRKALVLSQIGPPRSYNSLGPAVVVSKTCLICMFIYMVQRSNPPPLRPPPPLWCGVGWFWLSHSTSTTSSISY